MTGLSDFWFIFSDGLHDYFYFVSNEVFKNYNSTPVLKNGINSNAWWGHYFLRALQLTSL